MADPVMARRCLDAGASFVAVGVDTTLLVRAARELLQGCRPAAGAAVPAGRQGAPEATPNDAGQGSC
jgi:4-hydroxy-2-oxoheptanedioate aldolase